MHLKTDLRKGNFSWVHGWRGRKLKRRRGRRGGGGRDEGMALDSPVT